MDVRDTNDGYSRISEQRRLLDGSVQAPSTRQESDHGKLSVRQHWGMVLALVLLTVGDSVLGAKLFWVYEPGLANFLNQATGAVYIITSTIHRAALGFWAKRSGDVKEYSTKPPVPYYMLILIGVLNGTGNFFQAIGQTHVSGTTQTIVMLIGIPLVMLLTAVFLRKRPTKLAAVGAYFIFAGTVVALLPSLIPSYSHGSGGGDAVQVFWYSEVIFLLGQVFFASEKVVEEASFNKWSQLDVLRMFQWTMVVQTILYFAYYPIQTFSAFGGLNLSDLPGVIRDGVLCTGAGAPKESDLGPCTWKNPVIFFCYCAVDYCCYGMQLYVIQKGGANLVVLATGLSLPLSNLSFNLPFNSEGFNTPFQAPNLVGLIFAIVGFVIYQKYGETRIRRESDRHEDDLDY